MNFLGIFILIAFKIIEISSAKNKNFDFGARYTSLECRSNNSTVITRYCFLKAYSRRVVTCNIGATIIKPLIRPLYAEIIYSYKYGTIFREVIHSPKIEVCGIMEGSDSNPIIASIKNEIQDSAPQLFQKCPYKGDLDLNITTNHAKAASLLWEGYYKFELHIWKNDKEVFYLNLGSHIKSEFKGSFG